MASIVALLLLSVAAVPARVKVVVASVMQLLDIYPTQSPPC